MTKDEWHKVGNRRSELRKALDSEVMREAMHVLLDEELAKKSQNGTTAMETLLLNGMRNVKTEGFHSYAAALRALAEEPSTETRVTPSTRKLNVIRPFDTPEPPK